MFTAEDIKIIEDHINNFHGKASMVLCEHTNEATVKEVGYNCKKCNAPVKIANDRDYPVNAAIVSYPVCHSERKTVTINITEN